MENLTLSIVSWLLVLLALIGMFYVVVIRPWHLRWGATEAEGRRPMPGDDIVQWPDFNATRAITVNAHPDEIWPWLLQIGYRRAGWYSYDLIDNLGIPSADSLIPEMQYMAQGQRVYLTPDGRQTLRTIQVEPGLVLWSADDDSMTWCWGLYPVDDRHTRLITRVRVHYTWIKPSQFLFNFLFDVGDIVMMRKCLLGIKRRAENYAAHKVVT